MNLNRTIEQWKNCDPTEMDKMSDAAIMYAFADAKSDIINMHREIERLISGTCDYVKNGVAIDKKYQK